MLLHLRDMIPALEDIVAKTRKKSKGTSKGRKAARVAKKPAVTKKPAKVSWLAKGYPCCRRLCSTPVGKPSIGHKKVLGAKQRLRFDMPNGNVAHCELGFGDAVLMLKPDAATVPAEEGLTGGLRQELRRDGQRGVERGRTLDARTGRPCSRRSQRDSRTHSATSGP